jgi:hypothetical protein
MSDVSFDINTSEVDAMFERLSGKERKKAQINALRSSARILQKQTEENFKHLVTKSNTGSGRLGSRTETYRTKKSKEVKKKYRIASVKVIKGDTPSVKVHIMSDFRAKFFELGTKDRKTRGHKVTGYGGKRSWYKTRTGKGGARGKITAGYYFRRAQEQTERKIFDNMDEEMRKAITKIAKK